MNRLQNRPHLDVNVESHMNPSGAYGVFTVSGLPCGVHTANLRAQKKAAVQWPSGLIFPEYGDRVPVGRTKNG